MINKTTNYTILFEAFVFMQVFNQINCRKLGDHFNVFEDFFNNWLFLAITAFTFCLQILLVQFGGFAVRCYPLNWTQTGICLAIGLGGLVWSVMIKLVVRPNYFADVKIDDTPRTLEEIQSTSSVLILRKNTSRSKSSNSNSIIEQ